MQRYLLQRYLLRVAHRPPRPETQLFRCNSAFLGYITALRDDQPMKRCVLAVDTGGTKCDALLARDDGTAVAWGHCDLFDPMSGRGRSGSGRTVRSISRALQPVLKKIDCDELHVIGIKSSPFWAVPEGKVGRIIPHRGDEPGAALALAGEPYGIVALAGTGSFVHGVTRDGRSLHLDGLGPMLGDFGSGYEIGAAAIRAAVKAAWHPRHQTSLADVLAKRFGADPRDPISVGILIEYMHGNPDRGEIASLAAMVNQEAAAGDGVARAILERAADNLAETLRDVVDRLKIADEEYPLVGAGGVILHSRIYWDHLCSLARQVAPRLRPVVCDPPAVAGIALLVLPGLGAADVPTLRTNLFSSIKPLMADAQKVPVSAEAAAAAVGA
jgi:N-acetylglucosamine kinase-like BadF-type ATPase